MKYLIGTVVTLALLLAVHHGAITINYVLLYDLLWRIVEWLTATLAVYILNTHLGQSQKKQL